MGNRDYTMKNKFCDSCRHFHRMNSPLFWSKLISADDVIRCCYAAFLLTKDTALDMKDIKIFWPMSFILRVIVMRKFMLWWIVLIAEM